MITLGLFDLPFLVQYKPTTSDGNITYVSFANDLFTSGNGPSTVSLYLDRTGYTDGVCSVYLSMSKASGYFTNSPAKGIQASPAQFYFYGGPSFTDPEDAIISMSWNSISASRQKIDVYYNSALMSQEALMGSCSISTSVGCLIGPVSLSNARMYAADAETDFFFNTMRFTDSESFVNVGFVNGTSSTTPTIIQRFGTIFNGVSYSAVSTTGSYITMDGTALSGSDYQFKSGTFKFAGVNGAEGITNYENLNIEVYPTIAGKYFYVKLFNPIEPESASITYPGTIKVRAGGQIVSFDTSSFNSVDVGGGNPYEISMSRTGDISQPLDVVVTLITSSNFDPFGYLVYPFDLPTQPLPPYTISWGAGDGAYKVIGTNNTLLLNANPGGVSLHLSKSLGYNDVIFSPSSSITVTYIQP